MKLDLLETLFTAVLNDDVETLENAAKDNQFMQEIHNNNGYSLVQHAVLNNKFDAFNFLVNSHNLSVNEANREGTETSFDLLNSGTDSRILSLLSDKAGTIEKRLQYAVSKGNTGVVEKILTRNPDICTSHTEQTAISLQVAAFQGKTEICKLLLEAGANCNIGGQHDSAAEIAAKSSNDEIKKLFNGYQQKNNPEPSPEKPLQIKPLQEQNLTNAPAAA